MGPDYDQRTSYFVKEARSLLLSVQILLHGAARQHPTIYSYSLHDAAHFQFAVAVLVVGCAVPIPMRIAN
jgi:hypothetical protein